MSNQRPFLFLKERNSTVAQIRTKEEFYALYNRGLIGNMLRNWTVDEWSKLREYPVDTVAVRCKSAAMPFMRYDLQPDSALEYVLDICSKHTVGPEWFQFAECAPDHDNTLQGEVMRSPGYVYLQYSLHGGQRMRHMLSTHGATKHVEGLRAVMLLKQYMDAKAYDTLQYIWDRWPDAVVEFCCYKYALGVMKSNTLFWEARTGY